MANIEQTHQSPISTADPNNAPKQKNTLGLIALIVAIVGFIFACIPGALIVGWVLLPIGFILSIVSLFMKGKTKGLGITALILSIIGTIVGVIVFVTVVVTAVDEAFSGGEVTAVTPQETDEASTPADESTSEDPIESDTGNRSNPFPIGTTLSSDEWELTINSVDLDANQAVLDANMFNEDPADGNTFVIVNLTITYVGEDEDGTMPFYSIEYVTADGNAINDYDSMVIAPDQIDSTSTLYPGASTSGNTVFEVPADTADQGTLAINVDLFGDKHFVAVK